MSIDSRLKAAADELKIAAAMRGKSPTDEECLAASKKIAASIIAIRGVGLVTRTIAFCGLASLIAALMGTDPFKTVIALGLLRVAMLGDALKTYENNEVIHTASVSMAEFTGGK